MWFEEESIPCCYYCTNTSRSGRGRPKKAQRKAAPLYARTLQRLDGLSNKEVCNYAFQIDEEKPKTFEDSVNPWKKEQQGSATKIDMNCLEIRFVTFVF
jgi:hypothetical protein